MDPTTVTPVPSAPKRPWWKRKWGIAGIVVAVLLVLGSIGSATKPQPLASTDSPTLAASLAIASLSPSPTASATASESPTPTATAEPPPAPTAGPTVAPTAAPTAPPPAAPTPAPARPILKKTAGRGDRVLRFTAQDAPTLARITGKASGNFAVISYSGSTYDDLLINVIGSYAGWVYVAPGVNRLKITSNGSWTVEVLRITAARAWNGSQAITGKGDTVLMLSGSASGITNIKNRGRDNFAVLAYSPEGEYLDLLVNEIGSYSGEVLLPLADPMVMAIHDVGGTWSMSSVSQ